MALEAVVRCFPTAPKTIIYDFACGLATYCISREPSFFSKTQFLVDRFHVSNHKACSAAFDMNRFSASSILRRVNSQACEQLNARLKSLRRSLSYMTAQEFVNSLRLFIRLHNRNRY